MLVVVIMNVLVIVTFSVTMYANFITMHSCIDLVELPLLIRPDLLIKCIKSGHTGNVWWQ